MRLHNNVSLACWNIDGLFVNMNGHRFCKLDDDVFQSSISKLDIVCLIETHCGPQETLTLSGFNIFHKHRPKSPNATKHSGGIAVCIKNEIKKGVKILPTTCTEILWLKLCKSFFKLEKDLFVGITYVSPHNSSFSSKRENIFDVLESNIANYSQLGNCLICGDFNARTMCEPDYCSDDNFTDYVNLPNDYICDAPLSRNNMDTEKIDEHGKQLLSLCKASGLRILNGRVVGDLLGHCTCYSHTGKPSVIDYMITSTENLKHVDFFHVDDPTPISIHSMLTISIKTISSYTPEIRTKLLPLPEKYIWSSSSDTQYQLGLNTPVIQGQIKKFLNENNLMNIDIAVESVNLIIKNTADIAGIATMRMHKYTSSHPKKKKKKKWYDKECKHLHRDLRTLARLVRNSPFDISLLQQFKSTRKNYKKLLKKKRELYRTTILNKLDDLNSSDPKAFWSLYDKLNALDKQTKSIPIASDEWVKYFANLMANATSKIGIDRENEMNNFIDENADTIFNELDFSVTPLEVQKAITKLKTGKSCGPDQIPNEMLKAGSSVLTPVLCRLFNNILNRGEFPNSWRYNTLTPLHKKGDANNPSNYRGIALTSNVCKLFCSMLHSRLNKFIEDNNLIPVNQIGYQPKMRTSDHIFTLKRLVDKYINEIGKGRLFTCFVDFKKAFDTVSRTSLLYKLLKLGIGGRFLKILRNMYSNVYYSVKLSEGLTHPFPSFIGVKQGCVLSPTLFNLFVGDLPDIFDSTCDPVFLNNSSLSSLMFADDLVILSTSATGLQSALNKLDTYCSTWGLEVNLDKTNILIFNKSGRILKDHFFFRGSLLKNTNRYKYLGIIFSASGSFCHAVEHLTEQAAKALFKLKQRHILNNPVTAIKLFDMLIVPILRYCSEVWGPAYINKLNSSNLISLSEKCPIEKLQNKFCRFVLGVNKYSTNAGVKAEFGRRPLLINFIGHSIKYWFYLCEKNISTIVRNSYLDAYMSSTKNNWAVQIKTLLCKYSLEHVWQDQGSKYKTKIINNLKSKLHAQHDTEWYNLISKPESKLRTYCMFKREYCIENYLTICGSMQRREFSKLRISSHQLRVETGRYTRPHKIPLENRTCLVCKNDNVEDEKHFLLSCSAYDVERSDLFSKLSQYAIFLQLSVEEQFLFLMTYNNGDSEILKLVIDFVNKCVEKRKKIITPL